MTKEEKQQLDNGKIVYKSQKDAEDNSFKQNARCEALRTAKFVENDQPISKVLATADKTYQWLIKVLK